MLVAAWGGNEAGRTITWLAVLLLVAAAAFVPGVRDAGGTAFGGLFAADSFAAFAKLVIYAGAAIGPSRVATAACRRAAPRARRGSRPAGCQPRARPG